MAYGAMTKESNGSHKNSYKRGALQIKINREKNTKPKTKIDIFLSRFIT